MTKGVGVKNCQNGGDVVCGWPLSFLVGNSLNSFLDPNMS